MHFLQFSGHFTANFPQYFGKYFILILAFGVCTCQMKIFVGKDSIIPLVLIEHRAVVTHKNLFYLSELRTSEKPLPLPLDLF